MGANDATGSRLLDMALEDGAPRSSLSGLFPANLPLPSLEDALMPLAATLPHLHPSSGRTVKIARKQAKRAQAKHPNISLDKCTAIVLYTMEEEYARETSLYYVLNLALRNKMRHVVRPWRDYVWLLLHALRELPPSTEVIVLRGCKTTPADLGLELTKGFEFTWSSFSSTATTQGVMQTFVGQSGPRTLMTIKMTEQVGRDVRDFSLYPSENEILYPPNMCFEIVDSFDAGNELIMVQCQQTETIDRILDLKATYFPSLDLSGLQQWLAKLISKGFQGSSSKYMQSTRDINTQLRNEPKEEGSTNFMNVSLLPGEIGEVVGYAGDDWVQLRLALGSVGYVRKKYLRPCPEGTQIHARLTAVPSEVRKVELPKSGSRFAELQALLDSANTHHQDIRAARIWHITGHYLGETGMVTGTKESLFHGTSDSAAMAIVTDGFDDQFSSKGGAFGAGLYFSPEACKSMNYTGKYLIVAEVALGLEQNRHTCTQPDHSLDYNKVFKQMGKRSCQCHAGTPFIHEERIVYHPTQCKPVYLIELVTPGRLITGKGC